MPYGPPATYVPREYRSPYAGTIGQLLGQNNGAIWGNAINTLGGIASDAFREKAYRKQEDARHATEIGLIDAYKRGGASKEDFAKTLGKDGLSLWNGLESATALAEGRTRSAREDMKNVLEGFVNASSPQTQAMMYPELKRINSVAKLIPPDQVPDEWNPQTSEMVSGLYHSLVPKKEVQPLEINGQLVDPNTREVLGDYRNEPTPPALKASTWVVRGGKVIPIQPGMEQPGDRPYEKAPAESKAREWVMRPDTSGKLAPVNVPVSDIRPGDMPANTRQQGRPVVSGDANRLSDIDTSLSQADSLKNSMSTGTTSWMGANLVPDVVTSVTGLGAESKGQQGVINLVKQIIGKALEGGVLRKEDEIKYEKILPKLGDPPDVAQTKINNLISTLKDKKENLMASLEDANYDVTKFRDRQKNGSPSGPNVAPAVTPPQMVKYQGRTVPFKSLPPDVQAKVLALLPSK